MKKNGTMMQYFEWYLPEDQAHWRRTAAEAENLARIGITAVWLPPAYKGHMGSRDVGYGVYDLYDLGEFNQKGSTGTKYGAKGEYLEAVRALKEADMDVYGDIVLNHKMGADGVETVRAVENSQSNRLQAVSGVEEIEAWTSFTFPGRNGKYSDFKWNHTHFDGVDWDQRDQKAAIYRFEGSGWEQDVNKEHQNYDYLMGADLNFHNREVTEELDCWARWYLETTGVDGFRLDAVKHISSEFYKNWLGRIRQHSGRELFAVGEYWSPSLSELEGYLRDCGGSMSLFDVPLHMNFFNACNHSGQFDMARLLDNTLVKTNPVKAVTFVENHDTQAGQALQTVIADWFKPLAYGVILLRSQGYPCVFYGDYYGVPSKGVSSIKRMLDLMCQVRRDKIYGTQHDYFDHFNVVGWTLEGDEEHPGSGAAVLLSDGPGGEKNMYIGRQFAGRELYDCTGGQTNAVVIGEDGNGVFTVAGGNISVWILKE